MRPGSQAGLQGSSSLAGLAQTPQGLPRSLSQSLVAHSASSAQGAPSGDGPATRQSRQSPSITSLQLFVSAAAQATTDAGLALDPAGAILVAQKRRHWIRHSSPSPSSETSFASEHSASLEQYLSA